MLLSHKNPATVALAHGEEGHAIQARQELGSHFFTAQENALSNKL